MPYTSMDSNFLPSVRSTWTLESDFEEISLKTESNFVSDMMQFILTEWKLGKTRYTNQRGATIESKNSVKSKNYS